MKRIFAGLLVLILLCTLLGCGNTTPSPTTPSTQATDATEATDPTTQTDEPAAAEVYSQAAAAVRDAQNLKVNLTAKKSITALGDTLSSVSQQELILTGIGTDAFAATLKESLGIAGYKDEFSEYFADGVLYVEILDNGSFRGEMTADAFAARFAPAILLDETLYAQVSSETSDKGFLLTFADPTGPESWALPQGAKFLSAGGTAEITDSGKLLKTTYTITYSQGYATISLEITAEAETCDAAALLVPQDLDSYLQIEAIEAPRLYDIASLYMICSKTVSSTIYQTIVSQAAGYTQMEQTELHFLGTGKNHQSSVIEAITSMDNTGATDSYALTEKFQDGQYTYSENKGAFSPDTSVTAVAMQEYVQNMCGNIPALEYITSAKIENINGLIYLEMELNPEWGTSTAKDLSYQLFQDANYLDSFASAYETATATVSMTLDPATGFPIATGIAYAGVHTIDGQQYVLAQENSQSYRLLDSSTYKELTGSVPAETAPAEQATPLLYRVTGAEGQEMYLMGTIHVGDTKTGFLPEEVYTAFDASDALAVEVDVVAFEEKLTTDSQLAETLAQVMMNPNNGITKDLLDVGIYDPAVKLLKASGSYNATMEYLTPYEWMSAIDDCFLQLTGLRAEKGMDMRLLTLAKEQKKKVLEVESILDQFQMTADFSTDLQALLLEEVISINVTEYRDDLQELYDQWCAGDETALREMLQEEDDELTAEEMSLYEEYMQAMIIDRNDNMLDVAISYLEGGETVFYAVGLAHLLQENGLVDTLRDAGYTVEQVIYG